MAALSGAAASLPLPASGQAPPQVGLLKKRGGGASRLKSTLPPAVALWQMLICAGWDGAAAAYGIRQLCTAYK